MFISRGSGYLGIHLQDLNEDLAAYFGVKADEGVLILTVETESPAKKAGLKAGDVIIKLDKKEVSNPKDIKKILSDFEAGDKIEIAVVRHKKKKMVEAVLGKRAGHREIRIFKGIGDKKYFKMPHFYFEEPFSHFEIPEFEIPEIELPDFDELEVIWEDKIRRKLDKKLKRLKDILVNKLRPVLEFISI